MSFPFIIPSAVMSSPPVVLYKGERWIYICIGSHTEGHRCKRLLEQAETHTGTVTQASTHKNRSLLHILSLPCRSSSGSYCLSEPSTSFNILLSKNTSCAQQNLHKDGTATISVKKIYISPIVAIYGLKQFG